MSTADSEREIYINIEFRKKQERVYSDSAQLLISYAQQLIGKDQASLDLQQKVVDWSKKCEKGSRIIRLLRIKIYVLWNIWFR